MFKELDRLVLLATGRVLYYGAADQATQLYASVGFPLPESTNPAEFFLDLAFGDYNGIPIPGGVRDLCAMEAIQNHNRGQALTDIERVIDSTKVDPYGVNNDEEDVEAGGANRLEGQESGGGSSHRGAPWAIQLAILFRRAIRSRRFDSLGFERFFLIGSMSLVVGLLWWQAAKDVPADNLERMEDIAGLLFFLILFPSYNSVLTSVFTFPSEYKILIKERTSSMYTLSAYYLARTLSDLPLDSLFPAAFAMIVYFMTGLSLNAAKFFTNVVSQGVRHGIIASGINGTANYGIYI